MSNDLKLWLVRLGLAIFVVIDFALLGMILSAAMSPAHTHLLIIIILFVASLLLSFPVSLYYHYIKANRWNSSLKDQDQIAVETLARLGENKDRPNRNHN